MTVITNPSHAMFFNGITDAVIIPSGTFVRTGETLPTGEKSFRGMQDIHTGEIAEKGAMALDSFTLEAWVIPDQGGVVINYENLFSLAVGSVSAAGPVSFSVGLHHINGGTNETFTLSTASPVYAQDGTVMRWDGLVYPYTAIDSLDSYNPMITTKNDPTALTLGHRELLHIVVTFDGRHLKLYVNTELVASRTFDEERRLNLSDGRIFLGGAGGEFRGVIESIHFMQGVSDIARSPYAPMPSDATLGLWRFEEPVVPIPDIIDLPTLSASTSASVITIGTAAATTLAGVITGNSTSSTIDLTASPYSDGEYKTARYQSGGISSVNIPRVPYNLLINPVGYDTATGKPNGSPPERVRLMQVNPSAGTITVESIHLDYVTQPANGRRGLLHTRSVVSKAVLISGDCLIDNGTGQPYQPLGTATQFSHKSGQIVIDESQYENHGMAFSMGMAKDQTNELNKFAVNFGAVDERFYIGHSGRHTLNHIAGHPYMGTLPQPTREILSQKVDGVSDVFKVSFPDQISNVKDQIPINSQISLYETTPSLPVKIVHSFSPAFTAVENGMAGIDDTKRALIAIGGKGTKTATDQTAFSPYPFLLKSLKGEIPEYGTTQYTHHLTPIDDSRIAILEVPSLAGEGYAPFVEIHYNAIDIAGQGIAYAASGRLSSGIAGNVLTLASVEAFGKDGQAFSAYNISIGGVRAKNDPDTTITATLNHGARTITFSSGADAGFVSAAVTNAVVQLELLGPALLVEKVVPDVATVLPSGKQIIDVIHTDLNTAGTQTDIHAPGGTITIPKSAMSNIKSGDLVGDDSGGKEYDTELDLSYTPTNYMPFHSSDEGQSAPIAIEASHVNTTSHPSVFHRLTIGTSITSSDDAALEEDDRFHKKINDSTRNRTHVFVNNSGGYSATATSMTVDGQSAQDHFTVGAKVYKSNGTLLGTITSIGNNAIGVGAGIAGSVADNEELFPVPYSAPKASINQRGGLYSTFDIIDSVASQQGLKLYVQPTDRRQHSALSRLSMVGEEEDGIHSNVVVHRLLSRGRVLSFGSDTKQHVEMLCHGVTSDIAGTSIDVDATGAPDSHIVKEIMPGAPVVTVTLGGPGQGAVNTKETWDPSPLARLGWNVRRECATAVSLNPSGGVVVTVTPLNNKTTSLSSWGTYCFSKVGRIYLAMPKDSDNEQTKFASAQYASKTGTTFTFASGTGHAAAGYFKLADGKTVDSFADWITQTGINIGSILHVDDKFNTENICNDGSTINDRLFQTLDTIQHDYQLGTQYASTRAMVEIPLFEESFFDKPELGIFPGPDNSMKLHVDCTYTAHTWAPNPVGLRPISISPDDPEVDSAYSYSISQGNHELGTKVTRLYDHANRRIYVQDASMFPIPTVASTTVAGMDNAIRPRRAYLPNGEWVLYKTRDTTNNYLAVAGTAAAADEWAFSTNFLQHLTVGTNLLVASKFQDANLPAIGDNPLLSSAGYEGRRSFYYDRANTMTQGGNVDYGLKQYVSAVEFRAGPRTNPHLPRIQNKRARGLVKSWHSGSNTLTLKDASQFPVNVTAYSPYECRLAYLDGTVYRYAHYTVRTNDVMVVTPGTSWNPSANTEIILWDMHVRTGTTLPAVKEDFFLNTTWANPYAPGGLRDGDTVWMNMHYTNPHAIEGLFCKSRGTLNEAKVWSGFTGGEGAFDDRPRDSIPMENFLIGNTCLETAQNFVQHVNRTIEVNYEVLGLSATLAPTVAYIDPYQSTEEFARVLLYDVAHDREFISFQDLHMQVQTSPEASKIGRTPPTVNASGVMNNAITYLGEQIDVAAGFGSENKYLGPSVRSEFIEAAMSHQSTWNANVAIGTHPTGYHGHMPDVEGCSKGGILPLTNEAAACADEAATKHLQIDKDTRETSTFFDTPDGTRAIPAFLALKGIRDKALSLTNHSEARLQHLPQWTQMDFIRRLAIDLGEVGVKEGVTDIEAAAREVVRLINQAGAKNGRSHARRPSDQFLGESERFDLSSIGVRADSTNRDKDPTAPHLHADFSATGSTHDPAPFWDTETAFASHDRGTHMGYVRAHLGRVVLDSNGKKGFSIVVHSTIPGASGRNFCVWMDNSKAQVPYQPQYLIGHGGRFRNYWCQPDEITGENMHPAPMPINRHGRPFAPITTLKEYIPPEETSAPFINNLDIGPDFKDTVTIAADSNREGATGRNQNTVYNDGFEPKSPASVLVDGLRTGTKAKARINFGGFTQAGIPGWAPNTGRWGVGRDDNTRLQTAYGSITGLTNVSLFASGGSADTGVYGYIPSADLATKEIGDSQLYGLRFVDHRGGTHTVRMVYKEYGQNFSNELTTLPPTLDSEVMIWFDDKDVAQGGFTIGKHMVGQGDVCGEYTAGTARPLRGNLWNTYPAPAVGIEANITKTTVSGETVFELVLPAPYDTGSTLNHSDILGYLGLPEQGLLQISKAVTNIENGLLIYYDSRSHFGKAGDSGKHYLYGVNVNALSAGSAFASTQNDCIISPRVNWSSLLTDEVIAAATEYALTMEDPNSDDIEATSFDCTDMYAADGRTLREWGVSPTAIRVKAYGKKTNVLPLRNLFEVTRAPDWGLQHGAASDAVVASKHTGGLSNAERDGGTRLDIGYIPKTVLHITTKYRGTNANTATPVLVDSANAIVDTKIWQQGLRGERYTRMVGDHIIPMVNNPMVDLDGTVTTVSGTHKSTTIATGEMWLFAIPASNDANSWGEKVTMWIDDKDWAQVRSKANSGAEKVEFEFYTEEASADFVTKISAACTASRYAQTDRSILVDGIRRAGSIASNPLVYFRGGQDSPDHWVPLYFGGGFSGVVMDINDGTQNDYSEFYKHPYAAGPTGSAGLQNIGETSGSYALLDANAMFAMFPGTPHLDQHKGQSNPPFFNQDGLLSFDLDAGNSSSASHTGITYAGGGFTVTCQRPSPIVVRFAHPHARYSASGDTTNHTTYMIFGPGQSIPHNIAATEPQGSNIVTIGNTWSAVPILTSHGRDTVLPNQLAHGGDERSGFSAYLPPSKNYQVGNVRGHNYVYNWEPAQGHPNVVSKVSAFGYNQDEEHALYYTSHFISGSNPAPKYAHPFDYVPSDVSGNAIGSATLSTTRAASIVWHMDGGYHPGGHFLDNHVQKNPKHPVSTNRLATGSAASHNTSAFRVASQLATAYLGTFDSHADMTSNDKFIVVDATRCQNAEEMGAVLSSAINTFPGPDPLKAIGGTFLPSFQNAHKQDRYGWVKLVDINHAVGYAVQTSGPTAAATLTMNGAIAGELPQYGWIRMVTAGGAVAIASYVSYTGTKFTFGTNAITSNTNAFEPSTKTAVVSGQPLQPSDINVPTTEIYVWSKAGTHRHNNTGYNARDHMCQVHFNGLVDAIDRTKPIGAVGWNGEAYSYLNSYNSASLGSNKHPSGLGAWHPFLGFSPYGSASSCAGVSPPVGASDTPSSMASLFCTTGLSSRHLVAVSHESELPLIAKTDRDGIVCTGDWLHVKPGTNITHAGTTTWDTGKIHNKDRYVGPATAGPNVEALMVGAQTLPMDVSNYPAVGTETYWHSRVTASSHLSAITPCQVPTGDLFWDTSVVPASALHESTAYSVTCTGVTTRAKADEIDGGLYQFYNSKSAARNFTIENVVWKRMDGGNLTMPAVNARGLGMVPWTVRKSGGNYYTVGEKILGNCRFSFESTNSAMFPIIQAQELAHPQIAEQHPFEIRNALSIPNESLQFEDVKVVDDTGQTHTLVGGSPFGTIIFDFRHVSDREIEGLAPSIAGSGISPNMKIRLPDADEIPGNIIVRSGFDRIQAYQNETMGSGGLQHPLQPMQGIDDMFTDAKPGPRLWPTWENNGWEHISQDGVDLSLTTSESRLSFPDSTNRGWADHTDNNPLKTTYEPHDRTLYFHVTKMGHSMTHRYDINELDYSTYATTTITAGSAPSAAVWQDATEQSGGRWFLRVYDPTTNKGVLASYTGVTGSNFTGVVFDPEFTSFVAGKTGLKIVPSYYVPAGSDRFFTSRRLRDHSEYSGNSPDMPVIAWESIASTPYTQLTAPKMTPMPIPRMGHHYVTPTMALMPGHYAHPAYQRLYDLNRACRSAQDESLEEGVTTIADEVPGRDPLIWFSGPTATYGPSDIHGGAFTLLTESKLKYEGYGIAASQGAAGTTNAEGGHSIVLEAAGAYTLKGHFPDPMEVGAYQIIIQPNTFKQQLSGFHRNNADATKAPVEGGSYVSELTSQQVNTVIAIEHDSSNANGAYTLVLAEATMADIRGCEVIINEMMLDFEPDVGSQFTNLPTLGLYNPLGVNETTSVPFSRRSLPYRPNAFKEATPGYTLTIPWWAHLHKDGPSSASSTKWLNLEWLKPDNYYEACRTTYGAVGGQITLGGYPSIYFDIYEEDRRIRSLSPGCIVISTNSGASTITVDNNDLFPVVPYYGELLEYTDANGIRRTATYGNRTGTRSYATVGTSTTFGTVSGSAQFWSNLAVGTVLRLSSPYDNWKAGEIYKDSKKSIAPRLLPQTLHGTRDTNSLHSPDAFLCLWHPNLGRPFTWYSDDNSRAFYTKAGTVDTPVTKKAMNHVPEHFETIHYHDFFYAASKGPFGLKMKTAVPPHDADNNAATADIADGTLYSGTDIDALTDGSGTLDHQGGTIGSNKYNFAGFWPGGSRGGGGVSRLDGFGDALIGWGRQTYGMDCVGFRDNSGVEQRTYAQMTSESEFGRNYCFGYRFSLRQPYNRPRWGAVVRGYLEGTATTSLLGYYHGPFIQQDNKTNGWDYVGADGSQSDATFPGTYVGIMERLTQITALLNEDQLGRQVRYSDGRRMTRPFGCPVRTLRNASSVRRLYPGDDAGKDIEELANAHRYYMVDWWGNTRGEEVRRFPARGFGIRPAWDPEDAYTDGGRDNRVSNLALFKGNLTDEQSGNTNSANNDTAEMATVDWFNPSNAMRVGDRGDGRGVRWPTVFNESLLHEVSNEIKPTGLVLSHSTAEPNFGAGYLRPRNDGLQSTEVKRGISARLDVADSDGLLKPEASVGEGVETMVGAFSVGNEILADPVARLGPRIGLDVDTIAELNDGIRRDYVAMSTQAYSLHTDTEVGQRLSVRGAMTVGSRTLGDLDLTGVVWSAQPPTGVVKVSNAHAMWALGGSYVMEVRNYAESFDDKGWGNASGTGSSNPYQDANHKPLISKTNSKDKAVKFLMRPHRILDSQHVALFRHAPSTKASPPQSTGGAVNSFYRATSGGKYGMFNYDLPNARTGTITPTSAPYSPVYAIDPAVSTSAASSVGPVIPGADVTGFDKTSIRQSTARIIMSENTMQHFRSDAPRRRAEVEEDKESRPDYAVEPRYSQALHPKGEGETTTFNTGDHSGE